MATFVLNNTQTSAQMQAVINGASSGDTISFAAGVYNWNQASFLVINKSLTINSQTPRTDNGTYGPTSGTVAGGLAVAHGPVLIKSALVTGTAVFITSGTDGHIRVDGLDFLQTTNNGGSSGSGFFQLDRTDMGGKGTPGTQYTVIFTNCSFDSGPAFNYMAYAFANGFVFSHCTFTNQLSALGLTGVSTTCPKYTNYPGTPQPTGPTVPPGGHPSAAGTWNTPDTMGLGPDNVMGPGGDHMNVGDTVNGWCGVAGLNNTYVEDSTIMNGTSGSFNSENCGRVAVRHCLCQDTQCFTHGQDTDPAGNRHYEFYNNVCKNVNGAALAAQNWFSTRGGVSLCANNVFDIANAGKPSVNMQAQMTQRASGQTVCQTSYPANRQVGMGWSATSSTPFGNPSLPQDGVGQYPNPFYFWNNSGAGGNGYSIYYNVSNYSSDDCGNGQLATNYILPNRDFFVESARPGWVPYTYPHPLVSTTPSAPPAPTLQITPVSGPTPSFVQGNSWSFQPATTGTVLSATYLKAQVAGDSNIVIFWLGNANTLVGPPTDTSGNTYSLLYTTVTPSFAFRLYVYIATNIAAAAAGTNVVSATQNAANFGEMNILEYNSLLSSPLDLAVATGDGSGTQTSTSTPITTTNADDLIISGSIYEYPLPGTVTPPSGWNLETTATANPPTSYGTSFAADLQVYNPGNYNPVWTLAPANQWAVFALALKSSLSAPPLANVPLSWTNPGGGVTGYTISYGTTNGGPYPNHINPGNVLSFTVTGLPGGTYYFVVTATNSVGTSANSNQVAATIALVPAMPIVGLSVN